MNMRLILATLGFLASCGTALAQSPAQGSPRYLPYTGPTPEEAPPVSLRPEVIERVSRAVVLIERIDNEGQYMGTACAFVDSRGLVVTDRHCIDGASAIKLNLGAGGVFDLTTLVAENEDLDVALLKGDFPEQAVGRLSWSTSLPRNHTALSVVVRKTSGEIVECDGYSSIRSYSTDGALVLTTSCPAWVGCSGAPVVDRDGQVVGVVHRLGNPVSAQGRLTAQAVLSADVLAIPIDKPVNMAAWTGADTTPEAKRYRAFYRSGAATLTYDPYTMRDLRLALEARPNDWTATRLLVSGLESINQLDEAIDILQKIVVARPQDPRPSFALGRVLARRQRVPEAMLAYKESIKIQSTGAAWFWLAVGQQQDKDSVSVAAASYEEAVRLEPRHTRSWEGLLYAYMYLNRRTDAVHAAERQLEMDPEDAELLRTVAAVQSGAGQKEASAATMARLRQVNPFYANRADIPSGEQTGDGALK